jgi:hypothetical protein
MDVYSDCILLEMDGYPRSDDKTSSASSCFSLLQSHLYEFPNKSIRYTRREFRDEFARKQLQYLGDSGINMQETMRTIAGII